MSTYVERMEDEFKALEDKIMKLDEFLATTDFDGVSPLQQVLLHRQLFAMQIYASTLYDRIKHSEEENNDTE